MRITHVAAVLLALCLSLGLAAPAAANQAGTSTKESMPDRFIVTTLGTGMPYPSVRRFGPATLVQAGDTNLLFDAGRGVTTRLFQMGLIRDDLDAVFLTHLHSDHTVGLADLYFTGWLLDAANQRKPESFVIYGPGPTGDRIGTVEMMQRLKAAYAEDIDIRTHLPKADLKLEAHNIEPGVVYHEDGVKVTAFPVDHGTANPAFGYRVDYGGRSVVLSGDTDYKPGEPLLEAAKGADVVIHEVMAASDAFLDTPKGKGIMSLHTAPREAGKVFAAIKPDLAVYYHVVLLGQPRPTLQGVLDATRETYNGPLIVAEDLMSIVIGKDDTIKVLQPKLGLLPVAPANKTGPVRWNPY